ncbi:MAG: PDZ domain-containing protein [Verrucomicrobiales bacterium]
MLSALKAREAQIKQVAGRAVPSVVAITSPNPTGTGSGVVVSKDGLILTAAHVTEAITGEAGARDQLLIIFPDGRQAKGVSLGCNRTCDASMVKIIEPANQEWPCLELGSSDEVKKGEWVVALGQPGGFDADRTPPVRAGRVWARDNYGSFYTDCTLVGGDSGGPLLDLKGKVIGIHSSIGGPLTVNRHVAVENFQTDWDRLLKGDIWGHLELTHSDPDRPVLGVELDQQSDTGVRVLTVVAGGPADKAGIKKDDLITHLAGAEVKNYLTFVRLISRKNAGDAITVAVRRGESEVLEIELALASRDAVRHHGLMAPAVPPRSPRPYAGASIETAVPSGALVVGVETGSPAVLAGLKEGDIVVEMNGAEMPDALALADTLLKCKAQDNVSLKIRRAGVIQEVQLLLGER